MSIETKQGIPLEEAMKKSQPKTLALFEQRDRRQQDERKQCEEKLAELRANVSLEGIDFQSQPSLADFLSQKDYLEQMVILEKAAELNLISPEKMIGLFSATHENKTRLAIIENMPRFKELDAAEQTQCLNFLSQIAADYFDDPGEVKMYSNLKPAEYTYLKKYLADPEEDMDYDLITTAAIESISNFEPNAEKYLIETFKQRRANSQEVERKREAYINSLPSEKIERENIANEEEYEEKIFDERGNIEDHEIRLFSDLGYYYNANILSKIEPVSSEKTGDFLIDFMQNDPGAFFIYHEEILNLAKKLGADYFFSRIIELASAGKLENHQVGNIILLLTDLIGTGEALKKINELIVKKEEEDNQGAVENLKNARAYLVPTKDKEVFAKLEDFYRKFDIKEHQLNKDLNEKEVSLLEEIIPPKSKVLESGCGTGRLLIEMKKADYGISGYDLTPENIEEIKKQDPEARVSIEDWHHTPYQDQEFDAVYSLGRNILHEYSLPGQVQLFRETARVLKPGGKFIFDIPDREKGMYAENIRKYKTEMNKAGFRNLREGTIHDSPDGEYFSTRYCFSPEDIENLAQLTGFRIVGGKEFFREPLPTGKGDENLYFVLEKI